METKENLETKIKSIFENAEVKVPSVLWDKIENDLSKPQRKRFIPWLNYSSVAASIMVLLGMGVWWFADQNAEFKSIETSSQKIQTELENLKHSQESGNIVREDLTKETQVYQPKDVVNKSRRISKVQLKSDAKMENKNNRERYEKVSNVNTEQKKIEPIPQQLQAIENKVVLENTPHLVLEPDYKIQKIEVESYNSSDIVVVTDFKILKKPIENVIKVQQQLEEIINKALPKKELEFKIKLGKNK